MASSWVTPSFLSDEDEPEYRGDKVNLFVAADVLAELLQRPAWHAEAACRGAGIEVFYPPSGIKADEARALCGTCPVRETCLADALEVPPAQDFGIRAGLAAKERRPLRARMARLSA